ncbi:hypothetical protein [Rhizobium sp.]
MFGGIADSTGFSAAEIENFDAPTTVFWWNNIMSYREHLKQQE